MKPKTQTNSATGTVSTMIYRFLSWFFVVALLATACGGSTAELSTPDSSSEESAEAEDPAATTDPDPTTAPEPTTVTVTDPEIATELSVHNCHIAIFQPYLVSLAVDQVVLSTKLLVCRQRSSLLTLRPLTSFIAPSRMNTCECEPVGN